MSAHGVGTPKALLKQAAKRSERGQLARSLTLPLADEPASPADPSEITGIRGQRVRFPTATGIRSGAESRTSDPEDLRRHPAARVSTLLNGDRRLKQAGVADALNPEELEQHVREGGDAHQGGDLHLLPRPDLVPRLRWRAAGRTFLPPTPRGSEPLRGALARQEAKGS